MSKYRHLISTTQLDRAWIESRIFPMCEEFGRSRHLEPKLLSRALYCLFYEPSFLTRASFERAIGLLGGQAYHTEDASQFFPVRTPNYMDNIINMLASLHVDLVVLRSSDPDALERAEAADAMPVVNGGSHNDHPTQALADICTLRRELGKVDGINIAVVGRLDNRNVSALMKGLALFKDVKATLIPFSGQLDPEVADYCQGKGVKLIAGEGVDALKEVDAIYLNGPRTVQHAQLLRSRNSLNLRIDGELMAKLKPHCIILDPMQRSGDFSVEVQDERLAFYRQAENALYVRMAVLLDMLGE